VGQCFVDAGGPESGEPSRIAGFVRSRYLGHPFPVSYDS
jgi:hypothetical protein